MQVTLTPHAEELLNEQLARGRGRSPEEVVERALETLAEQPPAKREKTPAAAVAHIRESRKGVTLGGLKIKDLIHEGHKY
jgi:Arc/MetJ-type ribon-helix-helix transcriptional regulator